MLSFAVLGVTLADKWGAVGRWKTSPDMKRFTATVYALTVPYIKTSKV